MASLSVRDIPEPVYTRLKERAAAHRRSLNSEVLVILEDATRSRRVPTRVLLERIDAAKRGLPAVLLSDAFLKESRQTGRP